MKAYKVAPHIVKQDTIFANGKVKTQFAICETEERKLTSIITADGDFAFKSKPIVSNYICYSGDKIFETVEAIFDTYQQAKFVLDNIFFESITTSPVDATVISNLRQHEHRGHLIEKVLYKKQILYGFLIGAKYKTFNSLENAINYIDSITVVDVKITKV